VIYQVLLPKASGPGRVLALEIMLGTPAVKHLIREGKTHMLPNVIQSSAEDGMISLDQSLANLYSAGVVSFEDALMRAMNPEEFLRLVGKIK